MSVTSLIAKVGADPRFIAMQAHCWFTAFIVSQVIYAGGKPPIVAACVIGAAAIKEFWFDATYETPKQTFADNAEDFLEYCGGVVIGLAVSC